MQYITLALEILLLIVGCLLLGFNWIYAHRVHRTKTQLSMTLPPPLSIVMNISFGLSLTTIVIATMVIVLQI